MFWPQDNPSRRSSDAGLSVAMDEEQCFFFLQQAAQEGECGQSHEASVYDRWISDNVFFSQRNCSHELNTSR